MKETVEIQEGGEEEEEVEEEDEEETDDSDNETPRNISSRHAAPMAYGSFIPQRPILPNIMPMYGLPAWPMPSPNIIQPPHWIPSHPVNPTKKSKMGVTSSSMSVHGDSTHYMNNWGIPSHPYAFNSLPYGHPIESHYQSLEDNSHSHSPNKNSSKKSNSKVYKKKHHEVKCKAKMDLNSILITFS